MLGFYTSATILKDVNADIDIARKNVVRSVFECGLPEVVMSGKPIPALRGHNARYVLAWK